MIASRPPGANSGLVLEDGGHFHVTSRGGGRLELEIGRTAGAQAVVTLEPHERRMLARLLADDDMRFLPTDRAPLVYEPPEDPR